MFFMIMAIYRVFSVVYLKHFRKHYQSISQFLPALSPSLFDDNRVKRKRHLKTFKIGHILTLFFFPTGLYYRCGKGENKIFLPLKRT